MCIICYSPAGVSLPDHDTLLQCFRSNPDGAGFMYPLEKGKVRIRKGFMTFNALEEALNQIRDSRDIPVVIHFRIGTQGFNDKCNTHPFPISSDKKVLTASESISDVALVHNGIIPMTSYGYSAKGDPHSDTYHFVKDYASLICNRPNWHKNKDIVTLVEKLVESKLAVMSNDGHVELVGHFIEDSDDGCFYSNSSYIGYGCSGYSSSVNGYCGIDGGSPFSGITDEEWEHYEKTGEWLTTESITDTEVKIYGAFLNDGFYIVNDHMNEMIPTSSDLFVADFYGHVYLYDSLTDKIKVMPGHFVVDDKLDEVEPDREIATLFTLE